MHEYLVQSRRRKWSEIQAVKLHMLEPREMLEHAASYGFHERCVLTVIAPFDSQAVDIG